VGGNIVTHPWTMQAEAGDESIRVSWADVEADDYRYRIWAGRRLVRSGSTKDTAIEIGSLQNGTTYKVSVRARYGRRFTPKTPSLAVTPNDGGAVTVALRDYSVEPFEGPHQQQVRTALTGATERVEDVSIILSETSRSGRRFGTRFDPSATATTGLAGAWVTDQVEVLDLDYEIVATVTGHDGVLASSLQTWLLGSVDEFAPGSSPITRVGTHR
jgi:hypothetical protein